MPYIVVENFKGGLDKRRSDLVSSPGTMIKAQNVHVTRGGELEKRKAFFAVDTGVDTEHTHPFEGTYGMETTEDGVTVFTTSYQTVDWYNAGKWIKFAYVFTGDWVGGTISHDKLYYRFSGAQMDDIHEITLPQLSLTDGQILVPEGCTSIDVSFSQPSLSFPYLTNYFNVTLGYAQYQVVIVSDNGTINEGRSVPVNTSVLDYGDIMLVNFDKTYNTTFSYNWGGNVAASVPVGPVSNQKNNTYSILKAPQLGVPKYMLGVATGGTKTGNTYPITFFSSNPTNSGVSEISFFVTDSGANIVGVRVISYPVNWDRKSVKKRITTTYTDIKVVEVDHPDSVALTGIVFSTVYGGKSFVLAKFANGDVLPFYDGVLVGAFTNGVYRESFGSLYNFIESISGLMKDGFALAQSNYELDTSNDDQIRKYSVSTVETEAGTSLTITGPGGVDFKVDAFIDSPCAYTIETTQQPKDAIAAKSATASFVVASGTNGQASYSNTLRYIDPWNLPPITGIFITPERMDPADGIEITGIDRTSPTPIAWPYYGLESGSAWDPNQKLCYAIMMVVNSNSVNSRITATYVNYGGGWHGHDPASFSLFTTSKYGAPYTGRGLWVEFSNQPTYFSQLETFIDPATIQVSPYDATRYIAALTDNVLSNGARNCISSIISNGVELLSDLDPDTNTTKPDIAQYYDSSAEQLAVDIVTSINSGSSRHNHTATRDGARVIISCPITGTAGNRTPMYVRAEGTVILTGKSGYTGGTDYVAGIPKVVRVNFTGTPEVGNKCWVMITDPSRPGTPYKFGATRMAGKKPSFCFTYKGKQYIGIGSVLYFSALNDPTKWDTYDTGSGFIDMANNFGGREDLTGAGVYQNSVAVFTERHSQLWFLDPDPNLNSQHQVLDNTGCIAGDSVVSVGAVDLFYLSYNGIRSLQSRENTDAAYANDIGSPIDEIIIAILSSLTPDQRKTSRAIIEPTDGRYWVTIGSRLFVLSCFKGSNIVAWSEYVPGFSVDEMVVFKGNVYVRSGHKIYRYGGTTGMEYDNSHVDVELPYLDANKPGTFKAVNGIDITCEGSWVVSLGFDYTNPTAKDQIATFTQPSFALGKIPAAGIGTHVGVKLTSDHNGYCRIANLLVHYDDLHSKHEAG